jgi:hypothetical protein
VTMTLGTRGNKVGAGGEQQRETHPTRSEDSMPLGREAEASGPARRGCAVNGDH